MENAGSSQAFWPKLLKFFERRRPMCNGAVEQEIKEWRELARFIRESEQDREG